MGMKVRLPNAFVINRLGLQQHPFPLGVSSNQDDTGVFSMYLYPQRVVDMFDLLGSLEMCVVFGVGHIISAPHNPNRPLDLAEVAASKAIDCVVVDANTITISTGEFMRLLSILPHYDLRVFDMPNNSQQDEVITNVLNCDEFKWSKTGSLLPHLVSSSVFLDSHDDCYLHLESYDVGLLQRVFERALQIYVGTVLIEATGTDEIEVGEVPSGLTKTLWPSNSGLTILRGKTEISESEVRIGIARQQFDFRATREYPTDVVVTYNCATQTWHPAKPHQSGAG